MRATPSALAAALLHGQLLTNRFESNRPGEAG